MDLQELIRQKFWNLNEERINAYHGSPYDFEKFDINKIGSGDGLNKFGHGLYFADREDTAEYYAKELSIGDNRNTGFNIYEVMLNGDFLLWDEQIPNYIHECVAQKLRELGKDDAADTMDQEVEEYGEYWSMKSLYEILSYDVGSPQNASKLLVKCGVDGVIAESPAHEGHVIVVYNDQIIRMQYKRKLGENVEQIINTEIQSLDEVTENAGYIAFHGSPTEIKSFTTEFIGGKEATDQEGPGIYFTTSYDDALGYAGKDGTDGYIYQVKLNTNKILDETTSDSVDVNELFKLITAAPDWEMNAQDWAEDPKTGAWKAANSAKQYNELEKDVYVQVWYDFYRYYATEYAQNMTKLGYDGIVIKKPENRSHIIIYNPNVIEVRDVEQHVREIVETENNFNKELKDDPNTSNTRDGAWGGWALLPSSESEGGLNNGVDTFTPSDESIYEENISEGMKPQDNLALVIDNDMYYLYDKRIVDVIDNLNVQESEQYVLGGMALKDYDEYGGKEIISITAKDGYGPLLYLIAMSIAGNKGAVPSREPNSISNEGKNVWKQFDGGKGAAYIKEAIPIPETHPEPYLNKKYITSQPVDTYQLYQNHQEIISNNSNRNDFIVSIADDMLSNAMVGLHESFKDNIIIDQEMNLPIGKVFMGLKEWDDYSNVDDNELNNAVSYINGLGNIGKPLLNDISRLYKNYMVSSQNIEKSLEKIEDQPGFFQKIMDIQELLKTFGLINEDLVYWGADDAGPDSDNYTIGAQLSEDSTSLYRTEHGFVDSSDDMSLEEEDKLMEMFGDYVGIISSHIASQEFKNILDQFGFEYVVGVGEWDNDVNSHAESFIIKQHPTLEPKEFFQTLSLFANKFKEEGFIFGKEGNYDLYLLNGEKKNIGSTIDIKTEDLKEGMFDDGKQEFGIDGVTLDSDYSPSNPSFSSIFRFEKDGGVLEIGQQTGRKTYGVLELQVPEESRRQGIATKLMKTALEYFVGYGFSGQASNPFAVDLNYKFGFKAFDGKGVELTPEQAKNKPHSVNMWSPDFIEKNYEEVFGGKLVTESTVNENIGYKVMRLDNNQLVSGANSNLKYPLKKGVMLHMPGNGIYLTPHKDYALEYYGGLNYNEVLLTLEYDPNTITTGDLNDREPEISIPSAKIVDFDILNNIDEGNLNEAGAGINRLLNHMQSSDFAIMSANRNELDMQQNKSANERLSKELQSKNAGFVNLIGHWEEIKNDMPSGKVNVREQSFFIPKPKDMESEEFKEWLVSLGKEFNQDAVLIGTPREGASLYYMNGRIGPKGYPNLENINVAYSQLRRKPDATFVFEDSVETLTEERIKSWMPGMSTPEVKKSCTLGGNSDGTSEACSQGDAGAVSYKPLKDGQSKKSNKVNVAEELKWFEINENNELSKVPVSIQKIKYLNVLYSKSPKIKMIKSIIDFGEQTGYFTDKQNFYINYWVKNGKTPYAKGEMPHNIRESVVKRKDDDEIFDYGSEKHEAWAEPIQKAQKFYKVDFDLENNETTKQKRTIFVKKNLRKNQPIKYEVNAELWEAGGDWEYPVLYFKVELTHSWDLKNVKNKHKEEFPWDVEGYSGSKHVMIPPVEAGNKLTKYRDNAKDKYEWAAWQDEYFKEDGVKEKDIRITDADKKSVWKWLEETLESAIDDRHEMMDESVKRIVNQAINEMEEGVGDAFAEKRFNIPDKGAEFNRKYNASQEEEIITEYYGGLVKNPKNINNFDPDVRGVIDLEGNLYLQMEAVGLHMRILIELKDQGIISNENIKNHWEKPPIDFLTVIREGDSNQIQIGESNLLFGLYGKEKYDKLIDYGNKLPPYEDILNMYRGFIARAKSKNPRLIFPLKMTDQDYSISEINEMEEGVGDKMLQNRGVMPDEEQEFDRKHRIEQEEELVFDKRPDGWNMVKNPKRPSNIEDDVRGAIDKYGNMYLETIDKYIHTDIVDFLTVDGIIGREEQWWLKEPREFLTVQRVDNTNEIRIGDSNGLYGTDLKYIKNRYESSVLSGIDLPPMEELNTIFEVFLKRGQLKNPNWNIINKKMYENKNMNVKEIVTQVIKESYMNSMNEEILGLEDLPFKDEIKRMGGEIFSVGGAVRDKFLGKDSKDLDILITGVSQEPLLRMLRRYGAADVHGKRFGVIKFKPYGSDPKEEAIDIALPRTEVSTGAGHKDFKVTVDPTLSVEDDLKRRDFTINAMVRDIEGNLIDPFNGQEDLKNKIIKMTYPNSFVDDPLRMLRAVQFATRFNFTIEPVTFKAIQNAAHTIKAIPTESWIVELQKIVEKGDPLMGAQLLKETGLMKAMFGRDKNIKVVPEWSKIKTMGEFIYMLADQLVESPAQFYLKNFIGEDAKKNNTTAEINALEQGIRNVSNIDAKNRGLINLMYGVFPPSIDSEILPDKLKVAVKELKSGKYPLSLKDLEVGGNELMKLGLKGKPLGDAIKGLLFATYEDKVKNRKEDLLNFVQTMNNG